MADPADGHRMQIEEGASESPDPVVAVAEATTGWSSAPQIIFAFTSPVRSATEVAAALARAHPTSAIVGCTTAGEHLGGRHYNGSLVLAGLTTPGIAWATRLLPAISRVGAGEARATVDELFAQLGVDRETFDPSDYVCLLFIDGLAGREEAVVPRIAEALDGIPLIGGSAGDDLHFTRTEVIHGGTASADAAVLVLARGPGAFRIVKHQHFVTTPTLLAITRADPAQRRVYEIDGQPAAVAYAAALGVPREALTDALTFEHPLVLRCDGQLYVRSVRQVHDDDSISFYCAIEVGMVVHVGGHEDLLASLRKGLPAAVTHEYELLIGCNCILRALETKARGEHDEVGRAWQAFARHAIGFDTYGEQLDGLHINQTIVGVAFRETTS
jgi:hypothetical protein